MIFLTNLTGETVTNNFVTRYLSKIQWQSILDDAVSKVVSLILLFIIYWVLKHLIHTTVTKVIAPSLKLANQDIGRQKTLIRLLENLLSYSLYFLLFYWILTILGLPVSSLLAGAGIAGAAVALGAQGFLTDVVNGFFILFERQFDVGDSVKLTNGSIYVEGIVSVIGIRTTQIKGHDGVLYFVPNRNITLVSNLSRGDYRILVDLPLNLNEDLDKVEKVIKEVNKAEIQHFPSLTRPVDILGPQIASNGQFSYRVVLFVQHGEGKLYHTFYKLYQEALLKEGIHLVFQTNKQDSSQ